MCTCLPVLKRDVTSIRLRLSLLAWLWLVNKNYSTPAIKVEISCVYVSFFNYIINLDSTMVKKLLNACRGLFIERKPPALRTHQDLIQHVFGHVKKRHKNSRDFILTSSFHLLFVYYMNYLYIISTRQMGRWSIVFFFVDRRATVFRLFQAGDNGVTKESGKGGWNVTFANTC